MSQNGYGYHGSRTSRLDDTHVTTAPGGNARREIRQIASSRPDGGSQRSFRHWVPVPERGGPARPAGGRVHREVVPYRRYRLRQGAVVSNQAAGPHSARGLRDRVLPYARLVRQPSALLLAQRGLHRAALQV